MNRSSAKARRGRPASRAGPGPGAPQHGVRIRFPAPSRRFWRNSVASAQSGTLYRGREGMWSWVAHRISGMLIFLFLLVHVLDTALVRVSPEAYNEVIGHYKTVVFGLGEVGLVAAVVFHALNRSEERRVGKECRSRGWPSHETTARRGGRR